MISPILWSQRKPSTTTWELLPSGYDCVSNGPRGRDSPACCVIHPPPTHCSSESLCNLFLRECVPYAVFHPCVFICITLLFWIRFILAFEVAILLGFFWSKKKVSNIVKISPSASSCKTSTGYSICPNFTDLLSFAWITSSQVLYLKDRSYIFSYLYSCILT